MDPLSEADVTAIESLTNRGFLRKKYLVLEGGELKCRQLTWEEWRNKGEVRNGHGEITSTAKLTAIAEYLAKKTISKDLKEILQKTNEKYLSKNIRAIENSSNTDIKDAAKQISYFHPDHLLPERIDQSLHLINKFILVSEDPISEDHVVKFFTRLGLKEQIKNIALIENPKITIPEKYYAACGLLLDEAIALGEQKIASSLINKLPGWRPKENSSPEKVLNFFTRLPLDEQLNHIFDIFPEIKITPPYYAAFNLLLRHVIDKAETLDEGDERVDSIEECVSVLVEMLPSENLGEHFESVDWLKRFIIVQFNKSLAEEDANQAHQLLLKLPLTVEEIESLVFLTHENNDKISFVLPQIIQKLNGKPPAGKLKTTIEEKLAMAAEEGEWMFKHVWSQLGLNDSRSVLFYLKTAIKKNYFIDNAIQVHLPFFEKPSQATTNDWLEELERVILINKSINNKYIIDELSGMKIYFNEQTDNAQIKKLLELINQLWEHLAISDQIEKNSNVEDSNDFTRIIANLLEKIPVAVLKKQSYISTTVKQLKENITNFDTLYPNLYKIYKA